MFIHNIKTCLKDNCFNINISNKELYTNNYLNIDFINEKYIIINYENFQLKVKGEDFFVSKMLDNELLVKGTIKEMEFNYK